MIHYLSFRYKSSLSKGYLDHYCGLDPVGEPSSEQNSEQRSNLQVFGEQRDMYIHSGYKQHYAKKVQSFYNSIILILALITAHIGKATSTQMAIISFTYTMQWGKLVCSGYISQDDYFFLSLLVHIYIPENDSYVSLYFVQKLWKGNLSFHRQT